MASNLDSAELSKAQSQSGEDCLRQAVQAFRKPKGDRPPVHTMVSALVHTEQHHKQTKSTFPAESFVGIWRFRFGANRKARLVSGVVQGSGFYVPSWVKATLAFATDSTSQESVTPKHETTDVPSLTITNALQLGFLTLQLTGPAKYLPRKNLMAFDFHSMTITAWGRRIYSGAVPGRSSQAEDFEQRAIAKLPFFAFIAATDTYIAARGRGGGIALWSKE